MRMENRFIDGGAEWLFARRSNEPRGAGLGSDLRTLYERLCSVTSLGATGRGQSRLETSPVRLSAG